LDVALSQLSGGLAAPLDGIRDRLLNLLAHLEAGLDFVEEDIEFITPAELDQELGGAAEAVHNAAAQMTGRSEASDAWRIALTGWPNVGKSSLLNALARESAALVSPTAGTTRDYVRRRVTWGRFTAELIDTAGADPHTGDAIAAAAQTMTTEQLGQAHVTLLCLDASRPLNAWEQKQLGDVAPATPRSAICDPQSPPRLLVLTKADLPHVFDLRLPHVAVSSVSGDGLDDLRQRIQEAVAEAYQESNVLAGTAVRCRESLRLAAECLERARHAAACGLGQELVAAEVRTALDELGKVVGRIYTDDVLDRIFSRFCIGK
jgi:tRNA modification GTPase